MSPGKLLWTVAMATLFLGASAKADEPSSAKRRDVISADETIGAPPGFHAERRVRYGAIIGGAITIGCGALMLGTGIAQRAKLDSNHDSVSQDPGAGGEVFMFMGGVSLAVGLPLLVYGLLSPRQVYVRDSLAKVSLAVSTGPRHVGGALTFAF